MLRRHITDPSAMHGDTWSVRQSAGLIPSTIIRYQCILLHWWYDLCLSDALLDNAIATNSWLPWRFRRMKLRVFSWINDLCSCNSYLWLRNLRPIRKRKGCRIEPMSAASILHVNSRILHRSTNSYFTRMNTRITYTIPQLQYTTSTILTLPVIF